LFRCWSTPTLHLSILAILAKSFRYCTVKQEKSGGKGRSGDDRPVVEKDRLSWDDGPKMAVFAQPVQRMNIGIAANHHVRAVSAEWRSILEHLAQKREPVFRENDATSKE